MVCEDKNRINTKPPKVPSNRTERSRAKASGGAAAPCSLVTDKLNKHVADRPVGAAGCQIPMVTAKGKMRKS